MDDHDFDDLLKNKFEDYEHPDDEISALDSFRNRMSSFSSIPWYTKFRTETSVASLLLLFTLLNGFMMWKGVSHNDFSAAENNRLADRALIDSLLHEIRTQSLLSSSLQICINPANSITTPLTASTVKSVQSTLANEYTPKHYDGSRLHLGRIDSLPTDVLAKLSEEGVLESDNGEAYLLLTDKVRQLRGTKYAWEYPSETPIVYEEDSAANAATESLRLVLPPVTIKNRISAGMINKIEERKYVSGVGINLSPHVDVVKEMMTRGSGALAPRVGITAEWVFSPHWSVETSMDYLNAKLLVKDDFQSYNLPNLNPQFGNLLSAEVNTHTLSSPVSLKFRRWITHQHQVFAKLGYTPYFSLNTKYVYEYPYPGGSSDDLSINTIVNEHDKGFYGGTMSFAVGASRLWHGKNQMEVALFYEKSLGSVGPQRVGMQLFGVRAAYSIKVR